MVHTPTTRIQCMACGCLSPRVAVGKWKKNRAYREWAQRHDEGPCLPCGECEGCNEAVS